MALLAGAVLVEEAWARGEVPLDEYCRVFKGAGSQLVVCVYMCVCVSTYSGGLASGRLFIGLQQSSAKLLSCVCLSWVAVPWPWCT